VAGEERLEKEAIVFPISSMTAVSEAARAGVPLEPERATGGMMNRESVSRTIRRRLVILVAAALVTLSLPSATSAHNRGLVWLPTGECVQVGSLTSVSPGPDKTTQLDLDPTVEGDNIGTSYAAQQGDSAVEKGACP
jgi:hypothetical protein